MIVLLVALLAGSAGLNLPAWLAARARGETPRWLPFIGAPAILAWVVLVAVGVGPQSLSNVVEVVAVAALSVVLCYAQVFLLDRLLPDPRRTSVTLALALVAIAALLRLTMPLLPE